LQFGGWDWISSNANLKTAKKTLKLAILVKDACRRISALTWLSTTDRTRQFPVNLARWVNSRRSCMLFQKGFLHHGFSETQMIKFELSYF
jgi:hypothetical protein